MYVLITYDVSSDGDGGRRLRNVAKICVQYGQRVQYSVFECLVDPAQLEEMKASLVRVIDGERDSLRFYNLGKRWKNRVECYGVEQSYDPEGLLII